MQVELFKLVLEVIGEMTSLINKVVEISASGEITVYEIPTL